MKQWRKNFYLLWVGQSASVLTSGILQMALIWHLSFETKSVTILSIASIAGFLPTAVLSIFAGTLVDRWNRKVTIIGADLFISLVSLILAIYGLFATVPIWLVLVILFARSIGTSFHTPAITAITPLIVPEEELTKCNGLIQSFQSLGYMAGVAIAAVLYPIVSLSTLVFMDVVGALIASAVTFILSIPKIPQPETPVAPDFLKEMKEGYSAIASHKGLLSLMWVGTLFMFFFSPVSAIFPLMTLDYFNGTPMMSSVIEIVFSVGMILGGFVLSIWGGFKDRAKTILFALFLMSVAILISGLLPKGGFNGFVILSTLMGFAVPYYAGPSSALMQEKIHPQYLGRVFGLQGSLTGFAMPLGLIITGIFGDLLGVNRYFVLCGVLLTLLSVFSLFLPSIRAIDKEVPQEVTE